jgi:hypothetical protein
MACAIAMQAVSADGLKPRSVRTVQGTGCL